MSRQLLTYSATACFSLLALVSLTPGRASAQDLASKPAAEVLFVEGVELVERGQTAAGCAKLEDSEALDVAVGTLLHLADCYERLGRRASAWSRFREARSLAQAQGMQDRARIAGIRADNLEPKLSRLSLTMSGATPPGTELRVAGTKIPRSSWGSPLPFDPGVVTVKITAPGHVDVVRAVQIPAEAGARVELVVPPLRKPFKSPTRRGVTTPDKPERGGTQRAAGVTTSILAGLGLVAGGGLALYAKRKNDESLSHCPRSPNLCTARGVELRQQSVKLANAATVTASVSGALLATGLVVYWSY